MSESPPDGGVNQLAVAAQQTDSAPGRCCGSVTAVERRVAEVAPDLRISLS